MTLLSKYLGLYMAENKYELEGILDKIHIIKKNMSEYPWINEINFEDVAKTFYENYNTNIMVVDTMLHHVHLQDNSLREKVYIFVGVYLNKRINFFTGIMTEWGSNNDINFVNTLLKNNNIILPKLRICQTHGNTLEARSRGCSMEAIYISFLKIEDEIDNKNIHKLKEIFPDGYIEETNKITY
ncbi:MAG: hypothetical protein V8R02_06795 [Clostridium sp.]